MKIVSYEDEAGRKWATSLPDDALDLDAALGIPLGPPSLEELKLPLEIEVSLHNQLFARQIWTFRIAAKNKLNLQGALQAALKLDILKIIDVYRNTENGYNSASEEGENDGGSIEAG